MARTDTPSSGKMKLTSMFQQCISLCVDVRFIQMIPDLPKLVAKTFLAALLSSVASILLLSFTSTFIARLIDGQPIKDLLPFLVCMVVMLLLRIGAEVFRERSACTTAGVMKHSIRSKMYHQILMLGPSFTDKNDSGSIAATFVDGTEQLEQYVAYYIPYIFLCLIIPLGLFIGFAIVVDLVTALILLAFVPLIPLVIMLSNRHKRMKRSDVWSEYRQLSAFYSESLQGLTTFKLFNQHLSRGKEIRIRSEKLSVTWIRRLRFGLLVHFIADTIPYLGYGAAMLYVCIGLSAGFMTTTQVLLVLLLAPVFYEHVIHLGQYYHNSVNAKSTINSVLSIVEAVPEITDSPGSTDGEASKPIHLPSSKTISFCDVSFAYEPNRPVLKNCSFTIREGEMVAFVGASGVGKSTVIDLLFRFYTPDSGKITLGGISIDTLPLAFLRKQFSLVSQDVYLFYDTVRNNLIFGKPDATCDEIDNSVSLSCLHTFVSVLPSGLDTMIGERGVRLSGGERQRISIGRAVLAPAPVFILDEPTASVDTESERFIKHSLKAILAGKTVLIISHRLSTIRDADRILVMDDGCIVESGTHEELLRLNGKYAHFVLSQLHNQTPSFSSGGVI
jgi:ABC-type transport system involved in cytochrome bd biosynthesis fused ATPase/permease subunit